MPHLFSFSGRARRREYLITSIVVSLILEVLTAIIEDVDDGFFAIVFLIVDVILIWISLAVCARRCHDLGHSGWWMLIPLYPVWMLFQNSQPGPNEYGDNPKGE